MRRWGVQASPDFWEGSRQQGIYWAVSNDHGNTWSTARQLAAPQNELPVWAPVLFSEGPRVHLFFSGPTNSPCKFETGESGSGTHWAPGGSIQMMTSHDGGASWSMPRVPAPLLLACPPRTSPPLPRGLSFPHPISIPPNEWTVFQTHN